jgi:hypothetical protein
MSQQISNKSKLKITSNTIPKLAGVTQKHAKTMALQTMVVTRKVAKMTALLCCTGMQYLYPIQKQC